MRVDRYQLGDNAVDGEVNMAYTLLWLPQNIASTQFDPLTPSEQLSLIIAAQASEQAISKHANDYPNLKFGVGGVANIGAQNTGV
ncbi:MAG: hypothetical protein V2J12_08210 [Gammaproteobacteria bacterium]|nr:hypothetical protein [Gammaproteobacteria bacterium]